MSNARQIVWLAPALCTLCSAFAAAADILIADFEGEDYDDWEVTGEAFGPGPAQGTLPRQMQVSGYEGERLVNTFYQGDHTTGTLTSPEFATERPYLCFLVGGGMYPGETCIDLLHEGRIVRTATGPNDRPGGTERLDWVHWDVRDLLGQSVRLQVVDSRTGGWGHINIDQILQSDQPRGALSSLEPLRIERGYLAFEMPGGLWPKPRASLFLDGVAVRTFAPGAGPEPRWVSWDVSSLQGRDMQLEITEAPDCAEPTIRNTVTQSDEPRGIAIVVDKLYQETYRPQFHFTARAGWHNDPNGLLYYAGEYHLFFQHNPHGTNWGNMTWGHAVSPDLVHWRQIEHAIHPDELGTIFSGSGVVDWENTTGFATGDEKPLVCIYTSAGGTSPESQGQPFTQSIAYSLDRGRTFTKFDGNPILGHVIGGNRDPKVVWYEPTRRWIMALYLDGNEYGLFSSPDLKQWEQLQTLVLEGASECPDFFPLAVDDDASDVRWLFWGANGRYLLGSFDGQTFTPDGDVLPSTDAGGNFYAAQTWSDIPEQDGRRIQIAWMSGGSYPNMPFNQQMSFPCVLTLRTTAEGVRLHREPVREIELLHEREHSWTDAPLRPGENPLAGITGDLFHIIAEIELGDGAEVGFDLRGEKVAYSVADATLSCLGRSAKLEPVEGVIRLEVLLDRTSIEVFLNQGRVSLTSCFLPELTNQSLGAYAVGGEATLRSLQIWELKSAWETQ